MDRTDELTAAMVALYDVNAKGIELLRSLDPVRHAATIAALERSNKAIRQWLETPPDRA